MTTQKSSSASNKSLQNQLSAMSKITSDPPIQQEPLTPKKDQRPRSVFQKPYLMADG
jgi:hypothetical protein